MSVLLADEFAVFSASPISIPNNNIFTVSLTPGLLADIISLLLSDDMNENNAENIIKFVDRCRDLNVDYKTLVKKIIKEINIHAVDIKLNRKKAIGNISYSFFSIIRVKC